MLLNNEAPCYPQLIPCWCSFGHCFATLWLYQGSVTFCPLCYSTRWVSCDSFIYPPTITRQCLYYLSPWQYQICQLMIYVNSCCRNCYAQRKTIWPSIFLYKSTLQKTMWPSIFCIRSHCRKRCGQDFFCIRGHCSMILFLIIPRSTTYRKMKLFCHISIS